MALEAGRSFTMAPKSGDVIATAPTRLRKSFKGPDEETPPTSSRSNLTAPESLSQQKNALIPETTEDKIKRKRKDSYRKISQELARSKAEVSSAVSFVSQLVQQLKAPPDLGDSSYHALDRRGSHDTIESFSSSVIVDDGSFKLPVGTADGVTAIKTSSQNKPLHPEEEDLLKSMMTLSKVTKHLMHRRDELEETVERLRARAAELEREKAEMFAQLESLAKRLREEKSSGSAALTDLKIKFKRRIEEAEEQAAAARMAAGFLEASNSKLTGSVQKLETKLMEVPRLEESYLRTARGIVRQRDVLVNEKDVKIRAMTSEIEQVQFWKQKATLVQEECVRREKEATIRTRQMLMIAHNYRQMVKRNKQLSKDLLRHSKQLEKLQQQQTKAQAPGSWSGSLPPAKMRGDCTGRSPSPTAAAADETEAGDDEEEDEAKGLEALISRMERDEFTKYPSATAATTGAGTGTGTGTGAAASTLPVVKNTGRPVTAGVLAQGISEDFNAMEVRRLRGVVDSLRSQIERLHLKLSQARSYPLIHTEYQGDKGSGGGGGSDRNDYGSRFVGKVYVGLSDELMDEGDPMYHDADAEAAAEDKAAAGARIEKALQTQRNFQDRLEQIRSTRPAASTASAYFKKSKGAR